MRHESVKESFIQAWGVFKVVDGTWFPDYVVKLNGDVIP